MKVSFPFDDIYYLSVPENKERLENIKHNLELIDNIKVFNTIYIPKVYHISWLLKKNNEFKWNGYGSGTALNCALNNYSIIKSCYNNGSNSVMIIEDDVTFDTQNIKIINNVIENIPSDYNLLRFEWNNRWISFDRKPELGYFVKSNKTIYGTQCYVLDRKGMEFYINFMEKQLSCADEPLFRFHESGLNQYFCNITICKDLNITSTIQK